MFFVFCLAVFSAEVFWPHLTKGELVPIANVGAGTGQVMLHSLGNNTMRSSTMVSKAQWLGRHPQGVCQTLSPKRSSFATSLE
ncbi:hypothetical protein C9439_04730 [archaeon SCG-AAA382B04]|nr:hypothetical protein C9439_04730 [archaeon SCG-AAA382B04]